LPIAANRVFASDAALLVSDRTKREVSLPIKQTMIGFDTSTSCKDVGQIGAHMTCDRDGTVCPQFRTSAFHQTTVGSNPHGEDHQVRIVTPADGVGRTKSRPGFYPALFDPNGADSAQNTHAVCLQFLPSRCG
jgi:hypothetical protein